MSSVSAFVASVLLGTAALAQAQTGMDHKPGSTAAPSMEMHNSKMDGMKGMQSMKPSGNVDRDFAQMMRKHHQDAVDMARQELEHGKDPKMRAMAKEIISQQQKEIRELDDWLKSSAATGSR